MLKTGFDNHNPTFDVGGAGGIVEEIDWDGNIVWDFSYSTDKYLLHHDIEKLPNGNILMIAWEYKSFDEAIEAGRNPNLLNDKELWPDKIIEANPKNNEIVWQWHVWDHLIQDYNSSKENYGDISNHPELIDLNFVPTKGAFRAGADWTHMNSIDYNEELDQILVSVHGFSEIWIIDHSTTTKEAASHTGGNSGHGGDILYRWGNPQAYGLGDESNQEFFCQHDAHWIEKGLSGEGNILVFNNGIGRSDGKYSSVEEIKIPDYENGSYSFDKESGFLPKEQEWIYTAENPTDFYSQNISGDQRLLNGNTLICNGINGTFFEVTPAGEMVWEYENTFGEKNNSVFRAYQFSQDYSGLMGKNLSK